jgi:hypothetical protein
MADSRLPMPEGVELEVAETAEASTDDIVIVEA